MQLFVGKLVDEHSVRGSSCVGLQATQEDAAL